MGHVMKVRKIKLVTLPLEPYLLNSLSLAYSGQGLFNFSISDEHDGHDVKKHHKHNDYEDDHHSYKPRKKSKLFMNNKLFTNTKFFLEVSGGEYFTGSFAEGMDVFKWGYLLKVI